MEKDRGSIITTLDSMFSNVDHEVIKMVLQNCDWNVELATKMLSNLNDNVSPNVHIEDNAEPLVSNKNSSSNSIINDEHNATTAQHNSQVKHYQDSIFNGQPNQDSSKNTSANQLGKDRALEATTSWSTHKPKQQKKKKNYESIEKVVIILRGLPGSGKSTLARSLTQRGGIIHSTDDFFMDGWGYYHFDSSRLGEAHAWNQNNVKCSLRRRITPIIVDNTNTQAWEMKPYADFAVSHGYNVKIMEPRTPWRENVRELKRRTQHNVPLSKIQEMFQRYERGITPEHLCHGISGTPVTREILTRKTNSSSSQCSTSKSLPTQNRWITGHCSDKDCSKSSSEIEKNEVVLEQRKKKKKDHILDRASPEETPFSLDGILLDKSGVTKQEEIGNKTSLWDQYLGGLKDVNEKFAISDLTKKPNVVMFDATTESNSTSVSASDVIIMAQSNRFIPVEVELEYRIGQLHVGSSTDEVQNEISSKPDGLKTLAQFFPQCPIRDLTDFFKRCNYDIDWTTTILIDSGYKLNDSTCINDGCLPTEMDSYLEQLCVMYETEGESGDMSSTDTSKASSQEESKSGEQTDDEAQSYFSDSDDTSQSLDSPLVLNMNAEFASQLLKMFGPIGAMNAASTFSAADLQISLPVSLCRKLHDVWSANVKGSVKVDNPVNKELDPIIMKDREIALQIQEEELAEQERRRQQPPSVSEEPIYIPYELDADDRPYSFQEIMDLEMALRNSLGKEARGTYASILKLKKLKNQFKSVDAIENSFPEVDEDYIPSAAKYKEFNNEDFDTQMDVTPARNKVQLLHEKRNGYYAKARDAANNKMYPVASYYAQEGRVETEKLRKINENAAQKILEAVNIASKNKSVLDLHMLHVPEAVAATKAFLNSKMKSISNQKNQSVQVHIVTGRGLHSHNFKSRLKPTIKQFLRYGGYTFYENDRHGGSFCVVLKS